MERVYALGVTCIEFIQDWFKDYEEYLEAVNDISDPNHVLDLIFPMVSIVDSVFAAQLLLCLAFGGWLNAVMKWWFLEDRPYWWVQETNFYVDNRPHLQQFRQTCETGPGSPSGHSMNVGMCLMLAVMWVSHIMNDRKYYIWWWKYAVYPMFAFVLCTVMIARMYVATHFPHQCLLGALLGSFLSPALCIYVSDPFVWRYGIHSVSDLRRSIVWHVLCAVVAIAIGIVTYYSLILCGVDPYWTVKLAFRWCQNPDNIHVSSTPMYTLVQTTGSMLGWALSVTPVIAKYRHYTKQRSLLISALTTIIVNVVALRIMNSSNSSITAFRFYVTQFLVRASLPAILLRAVPAIAAIPYHTSNSHKTK